jgi:hypothetical protein
VSALEITIQPAHRGTGLSAALLAAMCSNVAHLGFPGTLSKWREWTGLSFDASGPVHVPGALVPVIRAAEHD